MNNNFAAPGARQAAAALSSMSPGRRLCCRGRALLGEKKLSQLAAVAKEATEVECLMMRQIISHTSRPGPTGQARTDKHSDTSLSPGFIITTNQKFLLSSSLDALHRKRCRD